MRTYIAIIILASGEASQAHVQALGMISAASAIASLPHVSHILQVKEVLA